MAVFTIPSIAKGAASTISLNKNDLLALAAVAADPYYSVSTNIKTVIVEWNSDPGNQKERLSFDFEQASPQASFLVSEKARDSFLLQSITLVDYDGGQFLLTGDDLPSGFDISLGSGGGGGGGLAPSSFSGSAKTWGIKGTNGESATLGASATTDTISYTISGGLMSMTYELLMPTTTGNAEISAAQIPYGIPLPQGYTFGDLSTFPTNNTQVFGAGSFGTLRVVGSGSYYNVSSPSLPATICAHSPSNLLLLNLYTGGYLFDKTYGSLTYGYLRIVFTLTDLPVVPA